MLLKTYLCPRPARIIRVKNKYQRKNCDLRINIKWMDKHTYISIRQKLALVQIKRTSGTPPVHRVKCPVHVGTGNGFIVSECPSLDFTWCIERKRERVEKQAVRLSVSILNWIMYRPVSGMVTPVISWPRPPFLNHNTINQYIHHSLNISLS